MQPASQSQGAPLAQLTASLSFRGSHSFLASALLHGSVLGAVSSCRSKMDQRRIFDGIGNFPYCVSSAAFTFFDPNDPACLEILMDPRTTIPELFAIVRQWVPQVQHKIDIIGNEVRTLRTRLRPFTHLYHFHWEL